MVTDSSLLVTTRRGSDPPTDGGVEVQLIFHKLRSPAMENFNAHFKTIFDAHGSVPIKGLRNTQRFALGAIYVYPSNWRCSIASSTGSNSTSASNPSSRPPDDFSPSLN